MYLPKTPRTSGWHTNLYGPSESTELLLADYAEEMHKVIKATLCEIFGDAADEIPALYGGSVNPGNACDLIVQPSIDGLFTGRAAWQADKFNTLIRDAISAHGAK